ncbi:hypothetical protein TFLX_05389 [Thermoflexales bacterium]|nr:hypothetical protein TFLX_05389 [Thermoflexales bacterium]
MGPGHLAVGLAAKRVAPRAPLIVLLLASELLDILCFVFIFAGLERAGEGSDLGYLPWSHGLFMAVVWSLAAGAIAWLFSRDRRVSIVIGLVVFSHWVLDFIAHDPDLPLFFAGSPLVGLGLEWTHTANGLVIHWAQGLIVELGLLVGGTVIYLHTRRRLIASARSVTPVG